MQIILINKSYSFFFSFLIRDFQIKKIFILNKKMHLDYITYLMLYAKRKKKSNEDYIFYNKTIAFLSVGKQYFNLKHNISIMTII